MGKIDAMLAKYKGSVNCVTFCGHSAGAIVVLVALQFAERTKTGSAKSIKATVSHLDLPDSETRLSRSTLRRMYLALAPC